MPALRVIQPMEHPDLSGYTLKDWKTRVRGIAEGRDAYENIEYGPFRGMQPLDVPKLGVLPVSSALGLSKEEQIALYKYSQGGKDKKEWTHSFMTSKEWRSLVTAVDKLPTVSSTLTDPTRTVDVFRAERSDASLIRFLRGRGTNPCYIHHGARKTASGIHHLASASFRPNLHSEKADALIRIRGWSARYVQYFGMHGASIDGGEVLIPAGTVTLYAPIGGRQLIKFGVEGGGIKEIFTLIEQVPGTGNPDIPMFDDFTGDPAVRPKGFDQSVSLLSWLASQFSTYTPTTPKLKTD